MAELSDEVKTYIVTRLAMYDTPTTIAEGVKDDFGLIVSRQQVETYNPERAGKKPAEKWCALHEETRTAFLKKVSSIPAANRAVRVRRLGRMAEAAESRKNYVLAAQLYEQIAKEVGRAYTNKSVTKLQGDAEAPLVFVPATGGKPNRGGGE